MPDGNVMVDWWERSLKACLQTMFLSIAVRGDVHLEVGLMGLIDALREDAEQVRDDAGLR